jgi:hypothetical protein
MFTSGTLLALTEQSRIFKDPDNSLEPPRSVTTVVTIPTWTDEDMATLRVSRAYYRLACKNNVNIWTEPTLRKLTHEQKNGEDDPWTQARQISRVEICVPYISVPSRRGRWCGAVLGPLRQGHKRSQFYNAVKSLEIYLNLDAPCYVTPATSEAASGLVSIELFKYFWRTTIIEMIRWKARIRVSLLRGSENRALSKV